MSNVTGYFSCVHYHLC